MADIQTPPSVSDGKGRPVLTAENYQKVLRVANALGVNPSDVVNMIISKVTEIEIQQVLTFRVEVRDSDHQTTPGTVRSLRKASRFGSDF